MVNGVRAGNCRRIAHHPPVDRCRPVKQPLCLCRDRKEETGVDVLAIARSGRPPTGFADAHFLLATDSPVRAVRPSVWPALLVLLPSLGAGEGTDLRGLSSLDC